MYVIWIYRHVHITAKSHSYFVPLKVIHISSLYRYFLDVIWSNFCRPNYVHLMLILRSFCGPNVYLLSKGWWHLNVIWWNIYEILRTFRFKLDASVDPNYAHEANIGRIRVVWIKHHTYRVSRGDIFAVLIYTEHKISYKYELTVASLT